MDFSFFVLHIFSDFEYFSDFGNIRFLQEYFNLFIKFYKNKKFLTQFKKAKAFELGIDYDIIRKHCESETVKTFMKIDAKAIIYDLMIGFTGNVTLKEKINARYDVLGYMDIVDKKYAGYCVVTDLNVDYSPKLKLYALANGNTIPVKIDKKTFKSRPLRRGDIIKVVDQCKKPKSKKIDGKWIKTEETEWWLIEYYDCEGDLL